MCMQKYVRGDHTVLGLTMAGQPIMEDGIIMEAIKGHHVTDGSCE